MSGEQCSRACWAAAASFPTARSTEHMHNELVTAPVTLLRLIHSALKPITAKNTEVAFSVSSSLWWVFAGIYVRLRNGYKCCTLCLELWHVFEVNHSQWFRGCFNSLGNFNIAHKSERGLGKEDKLPVRWRALHAVCWVACRMLGSILVLAHSEPWICDVFQRIYGPRPRRSEVCGEISASGDVAAGRLPLYVHACRARQTARWISLRPLAFGKGHI